MISSGSLSITRLLISAVCLNLFSRFSNSEDKAEVNQKSFDSLFVIYFLSGPSILSWFGNINRNFI
jgi:hypothetical protein